MGKGRGGAWDTTRPVSYKKTIHVADVGWGDSAALGGGGFVKGLGRR